VLTLVDGMCSESKASGLLILVPCPTFMTMLRKDDYHGESPSAAHVKTWRIVFNGDVKVRGKPSFQSTVKRTKKRCATFMGSLNNGWIKLQHETGYVRQQIGDTQIAEAVHPGQTSPGCPRAPPKTPPRLPPQRRPTQPPKPPKRPPRGPPKKPPRKFRVVFNGRVKVRSQPTFQASITGRKWKCEIFDGEENNGWIRLPGNAGFIRSHIGDTKLVEELKNGAPSGSCEPMIRQWRVVFEGKVKIRKRPSLNAPITGLKWKCSKFVGQMEHGWIKLTANAGYIKANIGPTVLAEAVDDEVQNDCKPLTHRQRARLLA